MSPSSKIKKMQCRKIIISAAGRRQARTIYNMRSRSAASSNRRQGEIEKTPLPDRNHLPYLGGVPGPSPVSLSGGKCHQFHGKLTASEKEAELRRDAQRKISQCRATGGTLNVHKALCLRRGWRSWPGRKWHSPAWSPPVLLY